MMVGVLAYLLFTQVEALHSAKVVLVQFIPYLLPWLIFVMLFFTFCKISPRELNPQAAIGPGACLLWQNLFNSWQIWEHNRSKL